MGYLKIPNLYKDQDILLFKECYALQKIHGTSAHLNYTDGNLIYFSGGAKYENFIQLFDHNDLLSKFVEYFDNSKVTVYGEAYGGKLQGMSATYGSDLKFIVFDVQVRDTWVNVPNAENIAHKLGLEFVYYEKISTDISEINRMRDMHSVQGIRNGMSRMPEEGVILRPLIELLRNDGSRLICKHKKDSFRETSKVRKVDDSAKLEKLTQASDIADEWVTIMRLNHVIDKINCKLDFENLSFIIKAMIEDIKIESKGEVKWSKECEKAIGKNTVKLVKDKICTLKQKKQF